MLRSITPSSNNKAVVGPSQTAQYRLRHVHLGSGPFTSSNVQHLPQFLSITEDATPIPTSQLIRDQRRHLPSFIEQPEEDGLYGSESRLWADTCAHPTLQTLVYPYVRLLV